MSRYAPTRQQGRKSRRAIYIRFDESVHVDVVACARRFRQHRHPGFSGNTYEPLADIQRICIAFLAGAALQPKPANLALIEGTERETPNIVDHIIFGPSPIVHSKFVNSSTTGIEAQVVSHRQRHPSNASGKHVQQYRLGQTSLLYT